MPVVRFVWWVISAPFRLFYWFVWQCRRAGYAAVGGLQRRIGQRNTLLLFAGMLVLFGAGLLSGTIDCGRRCAPGWEWLYGGVIGAFGLFLMYIAITRVPNVREASFLSEYDYLRYRREEWDLSWGAVLTVGGLVGVGALLLWLAGVF